jgi:hypothetical protein
VFRWVYLDGDGQEVGRSEAFPDQVAAEEWMGRGWEGLFEAGVEEVALLDGPHERRVYRMPLQAEGEE